MQDAAVGVPLMEAASAGVRDIISMVQGSEAQYFDEQRFSEAAIKRQLNDSNIETKLDAMKRILAASSCGRDVSRMFPDVVKNTSLPHLELKKLVYMYLVSHSDVNRDMALLAINSFQKDLTDRNQVVRAAALRGMTSIRALEIVHIVVVAIRKACADSSPYVRKAAALCVPKAVAVDADQFDVLRDILIRLMNDIECSVVGAAVMSFSHICMTCPPKTGCQLSSMKFLKENLSLLHPHFRRLCQFVPRMEPWPQVITIDLLLRYCHFFFVDPLETLSATVANSSKHHLLATQILASTAPSEAPAVADPTSPASFFEDYKMLLDSLVSLLRSQSPCVVLTAAVAIYDLLPVSFADFSDTDILAEGFGPLQKSQSVDGGTYRGFRDYYEQQSQARNLTNHFTSATSTPSPVNPVSSFIVRYMEKVFYAILRCIAVCHNDILDKILKISSPIILVVGELARVHVRQFFVQQQDPQLVKQQKLELLTDLCDVSNAQMILRELRTYLHWAGEPQFTSAVFRAIATLALRMPSITDGCLRGLIGVLDSTSPLLAAEAVVAVRTLLQQRSRTLRSDNSSPVHPPKSLSPYQQAIAQPALVPDAPPLDASAAAAAAMGPYLPPPTNQSVMGPIVSHLVGYLIGQGGKSALRQPVGAEAVEPPTASSVLKAPAARASVIWIIGRYHHCPDVPTHLAPDALRILAISFCSEPDEVKLQILAFGVKLWGFHFFNKSRKVETLKNGSEKPRGRDDALDAALLKDVDVGGGRAVERHVDDANQGDAEAAEQRALLLRHLPAPDISQEIFTRLDKIVDYVLTLGMNDTNYDIRDISRSYRAIISQVSDSSSISHSAEETSAKPIVMRATKATPQNVTLPSFCVQFLKIASHFSSDVSYTPISAEAQLTRIKSRVIRNQKYVLYSLAHEMEEPIDGYLPLPPFAKTLVEVPPPSVRDVASTAPSSTTPTTNSNASQQQQQQQSRQFQFNFSAPEEVVPIRGTNIPKMEFSDDLDNFYSDAPATSMWATVGSAKAVASSPPPAVLSPFSLWGDDDFAGLVRPPIATRSETSVQPGAGARGEVRGFVQPVGSAVIGEDDESDD